MQIISQILELAPNRERNTARKFIQQSFKLRCLAVFMFLAASNQVAAASPTTGPTTGVTAPGFKLQDQNGQWHELANYCGQWTVLYFYPKDDTPGCTTEACEFRDEIYAYRKNNIKLIGISLDDVESHQQFAAKYNLPFTLLSDAEKLVANEYGVLKDHGVLKYTARETFLVDPEGKIAKHYQKVIPKGHALDVLASIKSLSAPAAE